MGANRSKTDQYLLRLPPGLRDELQEAANRHGRSLNSEIIFRLQGPSPGAKEDVAALLRKALASIEAEE